MTAKQAEINTTQQSWKEAKAVIEEKYGVKLEDLK